MPYRAVHGLGHSIGTNQHTVSIYKLICDFQLISHRITILIVSATAQFFLEKEFLSQIACVQEFLTRFTETSNIIKHSQI